jgi:hypothetical protein
MKEETMPAPAMGSAQASVSAVRASHVDLF